MKIDRDAIETAIAFLADEIANGAGHRPKLCKAQNHLMAIVAYDKAHSGNVSLREEKP
jgi:hypothetical protein